jgi:hypothetical protein
MDVPASPCRSGPMGVSSYLGYPIKTEPPAQRRGFVFLGSSRDLLAVPREGLLPATMPQLTAIF